MEKTSIQIFKKIQVWESSKDSLELQLDKINYPNNRFHPSCFHNKRGFNISTANENQLIAAIKALNLHKEAINEFYGKDNGDFKNFSYRGVNIIDWKKEILDRKKAIEIENELLSLIEKITEAEGLVPAHDLIENQRKQFLKRIES